MANNINLPYRKNVAGIVTKDDEYLVVQRIDWENQYWKFPQGGIDEGETKEQAMMRELLEELGSDKFRITKKSKVTNKYDWDPKSVELAGNRWRGQIQSFFIIEFFGVNDDIKLAEEIKRYKWVDKNALEKHIKHNTMNFANYFESIMKVIEE